MPLFNPFTQQTPLPAIGEGYETATLDLKLAGQIAGGFHLAKDVAAFANHQGGTLLMGVGEKNGRVEVYQPLDEAKANELQKATSEAVRNRCSPKPFVDLVRRAHGGGWLLAVNVSPFVGQPVGVAVTCKKEHDDYGGRAYVFPVRTGVDSTYLLPEQLPMFMLPDVRRAAILLNRVPEGARVRVAIGLQGGMPGGRQLYANMGRIDEAENAVTFEEAESVEDQPFLLHNVPKDRARLVLPLDQVRTVVREGELWLVSVHAYQ